MYSYRELVLDYGARRLTYEWDILNSISAILALYAEGTKDGILCGIPVSSLFEQGLLWYPVYESKPFRRRGNSVRGHPFPSWSWIGWVSPVWHVIFSPATVELRERLVFEWRLEHPKGTLKSNSLHFPDAVLPMVCSGGEEFCQNQMLESVDTGVLCFRASMAQFTVDSRPWGQMFPPHGVYKAYGSDGVWAGNVHIPIQIRNQLGEGPQNFVAISQLFRESADKGRGWEVFVSYPPIDHTRKHMADIAKEETGDEHVYNVLLVKKEGEEFVRLGIGQFFALRWKSGGPWTQEVRLA